MKISVLSFSNPFVNKQDGGKIDIKNRLICINKLGINIDHYALLKKDEVSIDSEFIKNNYIDKINNKIKFIFSKYPISVNNRYSANLDSILKKNSYEYYLLENFNMFKYINKIPKNQKIFLRVHNIESISRIELFKSKPLSMRSFLELIEAFKYLYVEKKCLKIVDKLLFISQDEKKYFERKYPNYLKKYEWLPPICSVNDEFNMTYTNKNFILYYGDLTVSHNIIGIKRFIENVYKKLYKNTGINLKIVGKIQDNDRKILENIEGVDVLGYVDDLDEIINESKFIIAPIYTGAGVKIKVVHAIGKGKILITTPKGIEGTGLKKDINVLSAENYNEYYNYCIRALNNDNEIYKISNEGYKYIKKYYSEDYHKEVLGKLFYKNSVKFDMKK